MSEKVAENRTTLTCPSYAFALMLDGLEKD
jgi:hypothetical protein